MTRIFQDSFQLDRAAFLKALASLAVLPLLSRLSAANEASSGLTEVASGVYVHQGRHALAGAENGGDIANISFIIGAEAVAIVDTGGSARIGAAARQALKAITDKPIRYVINTHMHPDHVFGNAAFSDEKPDYIAHHKMARGLSARAERYLAVNKAALGDAAFEGTKIVLPTRAISATTEIDLGGRTLELKPRATAHTDNDLTILDKTTGTLILGDLLFSGHVPTLDGSIRGWLKLIAELQQEKAERVIPGHGPASIAWPDALTPLERYLRTIADDVRTMIKAGKTLAEASKTAAQSEKNSWALFDEYHVRNVTAAFAELEWE